MGSPVSRDGHVDDAAGPFSPSGLALDDGMMSNYVVRSSIFAMQRTVLEGMG
jgi:hypothetical protein